MTDLKGKVAIVLGASASRGTGWAVAEALAAEGVRVAVGARSMAPLQALANKIDGLAVRCDAAKEGDIRSFVAATVERYGRIDIAVNSAGLPVMGPIAEADLRSLQLAVDTNYYANVFFTKYAAAEMNDGGSVILITSASATNIAMPHFAYACAKAASDCLVKYAAAEYGPRGIRVNSILPGPILSDLTWEYYSNDQVKARFEQEIPLGRIGMPADFANAVVWLAGPHYLTGVNLQLNGGIYLNRFPRPDETDVKPEESGRTLYDRENKKEQA